MRSLPARRIAGFVLRFALVYAALTLAWPALRPVYRPLYCALGNALFEGGEASVHFRPKDAPEDLDVELVLTKSSTGVRARAENKSRVVGYLPTISLIAFVLATPIPWKRRWRALLLGLLLVTLFVALRMAIPIVRDFSKPDPLQVYQLGSVSRWALGIAERALLSAPASSFVIPVLLWVVVAFRRDDWELLDQPVNTPVH